MGTVVINWEIWEKHIFWIFFGAFRAPGWPETDSPRKTIASSGVETQIRALETPFVAIFRFWNQKKLGTKVFGVFIPWAPPKAQNTKDLGLGPWFCAEKRVGDWVMMSRRYYSPQS